jgi:hypothetical protein
MQLQPWIENRFRLISWWDMLKFSASDNMAIGSILESMEDNLKRFKTGKNEREGRLFLAKGAKLISEHIANLGLGTLAKSALRLSEEMPSISEEVIRSRVDELRLAAQDELRNHLFFWVPPGSAKFYDSSAALFNEKSSTAFPDSIVEIRDAGNCIAFDQGTAAVFHLMRAVEHVIKATWKTLGLPEPKKYDSWGELLKPMDEQLTKPVKSPVSIWSSNIQFFSELVMDLRAVKRGCRDGTMHVESTYDTKGAITIFDSTITLIALAAVHLDQDGKFYPSAFSAPQPFPAASDTPLRGDQVPPSAR